MLNDLFYAVLGMLPWTCALIAALLVLRHFARAALSARFFRLAWLILAVRLALPVSFAVPVQDRPAPLSIPLPTAAVRQAALPAAPALMVRGVLYTGLTRARELLIVVGDDAALGRMAENDRQQRRYSGLRWRLKKGGQG